MRSILRVIVLLALPTPVLAIAGGVTCSDASELEQIALSERDATSEEALEHGGGLNVCGCHFNRKTGVCHCHQRHGCGCECEPASCGSRNPPTPNESVNRTVSLCGLSGRTDAAGYIGC